MRIVYLTLGLFVLLNLGVDCRMPPLAPADCRAVAGGLVDYVRHAVTEHD
jgi:hypothetical protein